jgi:RNA polymerase sigma-70 factor (ECF subfamily)
MTDSQLDLPLRELLHQREWLSRLAAALVRDPHAAEDAAQQTWLQALVAKTPLRDGRAWLSAVLGNVVRASHRRDVRRGRREHDVATQRSDDTDAAAETNERFETQRIVAAAVQALDEPFRSTVLLHHFEGLSLAAIAKSQNVPAGTVRWRLFRGHELLRDALSARLGRDDWRRALGALCAPLRRSALLASAAALLLTAGLATMAIVLATSRAANEPFVSRTDVAAAAKGEVRDAQKVDRAPAVAAFEQPAAGEFSNEKPPPTADQNAMVRARIVDDEDKPLNGASLRLADAEFAGEKVPADLLRRFAPSATTGPDGRVALALRAPAELLAMAGELPKRELVAKATLRASADGYEDEKVEVHVANGDVRDLGTIELCAVSTIEGRVLGTAGQPLADVRVCVLRPPFPQFCDRLAAAQHAPSATPATTAVQVTGAFELGPVRRGPAIVWASKPGFVSAWRLLDVASPRVHCDDLVLRADAGPQPAPALAEEQVRVVVVDEHDDPVAETQVCFRQRLSNGVKMSGAARVDARGRAVLLKYRSADAVDKLVELELVAVSGRPTLASVVVSPAKPIEGEVRIVLPEGLPFEVRAQGENGAAIAEFTVVWTAEAPGFCKGTAQGVRGVATLAAPPGAATFEVSAAGCARQRVQFVPGETASPLVVTLAPGRGITGVVTAADRPVADAFVSVLQCKDVVLLDGYRSVGRRDGRWDARTGSDGSFRIDRAEAGALRLQVRGHGLASAVTEQHDYDPRYGWNDIAIELSAGGAIDGVVRDRAGVAVPRALVAIHDFCGDARTVFADAAGRFRCDHLRAGGHEVRLADRELDGNWSTTVGLGELTAVAAPHCDCEVKDGEVTHFDLITDRCRVTGLLLPTGFDPRGWRATLSREHDGLSTCKDATLRGDGAFALSSSSTGPHVLRLSAPGGPLGNVSVFVRVDLIASGNTIHVPLALAPFAARADGASGTNDGTWACLKQESSLHRVLTNVHVDASTLEFRAVLAPVGEVVLIEGSGGTTREVGRFLVPAR